MPGRALQLADPDRVEDDPDDGEQAECRPFHRPVRGLTERHPIHADDAQHGSGGTARRSTRSTTRGRSASVADRAGDPTGSTTWRYTHGPRFLRSPKTAHVSA